MGIQDACSTVGTLLSCDCTDLHVAWASRMPVTQQHLMSCDCTDPYTAWASRMPVALAHHYYMTNSEYDSDEPCAARASWMPMLPILTYDFYIPVPNL